MIRSHFGLARNPFDSETVTLLAHQQEVFDILRVHAQQGGLCLVLGEPGTGKSVLKHAMVSHDPKRMITPVVNRTLHTYHNTLRILCEAFQIEFDGRDCKCERLLVQEAFRLHRTGKMLVPIIDDAHLMQTDCLRKLRVLFEDFPRSHNLVLIGQPPLMQALALSINEEIRSRVTYSALLPRWRRRPSKPSSSTSSIWPAWDTTRSRKMRSHSSSVRLKDCCAAPEISASARSSKRSAIRPRPSNSSR